MALKTKTNNNDINSHRDLWSTMGKVRERLARLEAEMAIAIAILLGLLAERLFG